jgi:hypothetical protein
MASESKTFPAILTFPQTHSQITHVRGWVLRLQIALVYALIVLASWTPEGRWKVGLMLTTAATIAGFALCGRYTAREMGLGIPSSQGTLVILGWGMLLAACIPAVAVLSGWRFPPIRIVPWRGAWQYAVWALMQQFALQSFFYVRMESLLGSRRALFAAAVLFSSVHLPSPILTVATLVGGLFFCEMFRRYRTLVPLGLVHATLGLTIAASFSDHLLHHMRVGIGYLAFHR